MSNADYVAKREALIPEAEAQANLACPPPPADATVAQRQTWAAEWNTNFHMWMAVLASLEGIAHERAVQNTLLPTEQPDFQFRVVHRQVFPQAVLKSAVNQAMKHPMRRKTDVQPGSDGTVEAPGDADAGRIREGKGE